MILDYLIMMIGGAIGVALHVMGKIGAIRKRIPEAEPRKVFTTFFIEDWDSLIVSALSILILVGLMYFGLAALLHIPEDWEDLAYFAGFILIGYAGQRIVYTYLGTAEKKVNDFVNKDK